MQTFIMFKNYKAIEGLQVYNMLSFDKLNVYLFSVG